MSKAAIQRGLVLAAALALGIVIAAVALSAGGGGEEPHSRASSHYLNAGYHTVPRHALTLTVGPPAHVHPIRAGFLGLSIEYPSIESYAGTDPNAINPLFVELIKNLTPDQRPVIRIGGDSTDWMWWPVAHMRKPHGVRYPLTPRWMAVTKALTNQLDARLILGLDLAVNNLTVEKAEAQAFVTGLGSHAVEAIEPGNEPELYGSWPWYVAHGIRVYSRPPSWNLGAYEREFGQLRTALLGLALAGPATGSPKWSAYLPQLLTAAPYLRLVTLHRYPLQLCYTPTSSSQYPTIANLLSAQASRGLAATVAPYARIAHAHGIPLRIAEMNTNSCGRSPQVTKSFASALWAVDALFAMAAVGVDGVNIHTYNQSSYELFSFTRENAQWRARVYPEYYGLEFFAQATPAGSRLLRVGGTAPRLLRAWATRGPDGRTRVVLINDDLKHARTVSIKASTNTSGGLVRLQPRSGGTLTQPENLRPTAGYYLIRVPAASAVLLTG